MENSMEYPQNIENKTIIWSSNCTSGCDICMITAALFIITKTWKQPKCSLMDEWIKKMWYIYSVEYHPPIKEQTPTICNSMDGPWRHYAKWNKSDIERQMLYDITCKWNIQKAKLVDTEQIGGCQRWWQGGRGNGWRWTRGVNFQLQIRSEM